MAEVTTKMTVTTVTKAEMSVRLSGKMIVELLRAAGHEIPPLAKVSVQVPGGGDWSGEKLEVDEETPVSVHWSRETLEREDVEV